MKLIEFLRQKEGTNWSELEDEIVICKNKPNVRENKRFIVRRKQSRLALL